MPNPKHKAFTLIELLVTLSMSCILAFIALPKLSAVIEKKRANAITFTIQRTLSFARKKAVMRRKTITVCGIQHTEKCVEENIRALLVFDDSNKNKQRDSNEALYLKQQIQTKGQVTLFASLDARHINFKQQGETQQAGSFIYCVPGAPQLARRVTFSMSGRSYLGRDKNKDGIIEHASGKPITCS